MVYTIHHGEGGLGAPGCPRSDTCPWRKVAQRWPSDPLLEIDPRRFFVFFANRPFKFFYSNPPSIFFANYRPRATHPTAPFPATLLPPQPAVHPPRPPPPPSLTITLTLASPAAAPLPSAPAAGRRPLPLALLHCRRLPSLAAAPSRAPHVSTPTVATPLTPAVRSAPPAGGVPVADLVRSALWRRRPPI